LTEFVGFPRISWFTFSIKADSRRNGWWRPFKTVKKEEDKESLALAVRKSCDFFNKKSF